MGAIVELRDFATTSLALFSKLSSSSLVSVAPFRQVAKQKVHPWLPLRRRRGKLFRDPRKSLVYPRKGGSDDPPSVTGTGVGSSTGAGVGSSTGAGVGSSIGAGVVASGAGVLGSVRGRETSKRQHSGGAEHDF